MFCGLKWLQVLLTTPTTPPDRMKAITAASGGFVYLVKHTSKYSEILINYFIEV